MPIVERSLAGTALTVHGHSKPPSPTYRSWECARRRCRDPLHRSYRYYGAVGVTMDPRWDSFEAFLMDMGERPPGMELSRKGDVGNYTADNCEWEPTGTNRNWRRKRGA